MSIGIRQWWENTDKKQLLALLFLFILAFGIRTHLMQFDLLFGFDSYWHARVVSYLIQDGSIPESDPLAYYQLESAPLGNPGPVFWFLTAAAYKIFTLNAPYDQDTWIIFVKLLPALFGSLISVMLFFVIREMYPGKGGVAAGYAAAFFAAVVPSFVYRTMAGFFEEDSLGFLWMLIGFYFLVKAIREPRLAQTNLVNAALAGIFFGIMAWTWGMFILVYLVVTAFAVTTFVVMVLRKDSRQVLKAFAVLIIGIMVIFSGMATVYKGQSWVNSMTTYVTQYAPVSQENIERAQDSGPGVLQKTIGEESIGNKYWGTKYNALILFLLPVNIPGSSMVIPLLILALVGWRMYRDPKDRVSLLLLFWVVVTLFMAWNKLKFTYVLGLPIAASAGFVFHEALIFLHGRTDFEKKVVAIGMGFMMLIGIAAASYFITEQFPNIEQNNGWKDALYWMQDNTPEDAKFFNWWDEGHWITFVAQRGVIEDNRNYHFEADIATAQFILSEDEEEAYRIVQEFGSDYVILSRDLLAKMPSMVFYAYNTDNLSDPRTQLYVGISFDCQPSFDALTQVGSYFCGPNQFAAQELTQMPEVYQTTPNNLQQGQPFFVYRDPENRYIYGANAKANATMLARLWFNDPSITRFTEVYGNGGVKIFSVN